MLLIWLETITRWNKIITFCLDVVDTKNNDTNTEKLKGTLRKRKKTEGYDLVSEPSSNTNWCKSCDYLVTQPIINIEIWS
jgi:hypothetical protein